MVFRCSRELQRVDGEYWARTGTRAGQSNGDRRDGSEWCAGRDGRQHGWRWRYFTRSQTHTRQVRWVFLK